MLHSIKKRVARVSHTVEMQAEIESYQSLLRKVRSNLAESVAEASIANKLWLKQVQQQRTFSNTFNEGYVPFSAADETAKVASDFAAGSRERYDRFVRETMPETAPFHRMEESVRRYMNEIDEVELLCPGLLEAKAEVERYGSKVDGLAKKKGVQEKTSRNLSKQEASQASYDALSNSVLDRQKATYGKAPMVSQMALVSFWEGQRCQLQIMQDTMRETSAFSEKHAKALADVDVAAITPAAGSAVVAAPPSPAQPEAGATVPATVEVEKAERIIPEPVKQNAAEPVKSVPAEKPTLGGDKGKHGKKGKSTEAAPTGRRFGKALSFRRKS